MRALVALADPVSSLVASFPGAAAVADSPHWLDDWFSQLVEDYANGSAPKEVLITVSSAAEAGADLRPLAKQPVEKQVRFLTIEPRHFRGFRRITAPVAIHENLVVIEGRNSTGKTSLSEAIEWVLTGVLSRRASGQYGHPRELANCIANEFTPPDEDTWVELVLVIDGVKTTLRRTLKVDYATQLASTPESILTVNDRELDKTGEATLLNELFAGLHPILMQHTLRQFVHDPPSARRQYFERLLQIDELTALISHAVIGNTTAESFKPRTGSPALDAINLLLKSVDDPQARARLEALFTTEPESAQQTFRAALVFVAQTTFPDLLRSDTTFNQCRDAIEIAQASVREARLPVLRSLRRPFGQAIPDAGQLTKAQNELSAGVSALKAAETAAASLDDAKRAVAQAVDILGNVGLIDTLQSENQECPVCLAPGETLRPERVAEVSSWAPIAVTLKTARRTYEERRKTLDKEVKALQISAQRFKVALPEGEELAGMLEGLATPIRTAVNASCEAAKTLSVAADRLVEGLELVDQDRPLDADFLASLSAAFQTYRDRMSHLEELVGASAREDAVYLARDRWMSATGTLSSISEEISWRQARRKAQERLEHIRRALITLREEIIEDARKTVSAQITTVWELLRRDTGARFSQIQIPTARGRGYKLELEVKATISDATETREVDALRVFSESQVNVIGVAAYVTRSRLLGHRVLIFDDPVQSMDAEHFRTFADTLLDKLLHEGFQVIVLTHSDEFARRIGHYHFRRKDYATLLTRFSKREGCQVDEGNRRVPERLKIARKLGEEGKLEEGWRFVRLGIERLYTLVKLLSDPGFDAESWQNATAEVMWNQGVGAFVEDKVPGTSTRFKEILKLSALGAHDKTAPSQTDLNDAIDDLRSLLTKLRVGG